MKMKYVLVLVLMLLTITLEAQNSFKRKYADLSNLEIAVARKKGIRQVVSTKDFIETINFHFSETSDAFDNMTIKFLMVDDKKYYYVELTSSEVPRIGIMQLMVQKGLYYLTNNNINEYPNSIGILTCSGKEGCKPNFLSINADGFLNFECFKNCDDSLANPAEECICEMGSSFKTGKGI